MVRRSREESVRVEGWIDSLKLKLTTRTITLDPIGRSPIRDTKLGRLAMAIVSQLP